MIEGDPAPLPAGNAESAVFARAEQYVRGVLLEDSAMQGCCCSAGVSSLMMSVHAAPSAKLSDESDGRSGASETWHDRLADGASGVSET